MNQAIKSTSEQIAHYANLLSGQSSIPKTAKYPRPAEIVPSERLQMGKRSKPLPPLENINKTLKKHKIDSSNVRKMQWRLRKRAKGDVFLFTYSTVYKSLPTICCQEKHIKI